MSTQMLPDELKCLWLNFSMKTPVASARDSLTSMLPNSCLLSRSQPAAPCSRRGARLLRAYVWPTPHVSTSYRHVIQLSLSWTLSNLQEDTIQNLADYSQCLRQHSVQEQTQIFVRHRLNSFTESINSCRYPFMIMSFSVCCLQLSRVLTTLIQIMIGVHVKVNIF